MIMGGKTFKLLGLIFLKQIKSHKIQVIFASLLAIVQALFIIPTPMLTKNLIDGLTQGQTNSQRIGIIACLILSLLLFNLFSYISQKFFLIISSEIAKKVKDEVVFHLFLLDYKEYLKANIGFFVSLVRNDVGLVSAAILELTVNLARDTLILIVALSYLFYMSPTLAGLVTITVPFYIISSIVFGKKLRQASIKLSQIGDKEVSLLKESWSAYLISKWSQAKDYLENNFAIISAQSRDAQISIFSTSILNITANNISIGIINILIMGIGCFEVKSGRLSMGDFLAFISLSSFVFGPMGRIINLNISWQKVRVAAERINNFLCILQEDDMKNTLTHIEEISFVNASFAYHINRPIFNSMSLTFHKGERILIVGESGVGKSTLFKVIIGLCSLYKGEICFNDSPIHLWNLTSIRQKIAIVEQEPFLVNDSIFVNIALGLTKEMLLLSKEEISAMVYQVAASTGCEFALALPNGFNEIILPGGTNLSIGQKQRIALARAILRKPDVLLLDEVTANLDKDSRVAMHNLIEALPSDMMILMVTHLENEVQWADRKINLVDGKFEDITKNKAEIF